MNKHFGLTPLRYKKLKELFSTVHGRWNSFNKVGDVRYGRNLFKYLFQPRHTNYFVFCVEEACDTFKVKHISNYTMEQVIDIAYSNFILGEYNVSSMGAGFKFNTIRNVFKYNFHTSEYMINHYSDKLSLPIIQFLKKEFADRDYLNIVIPVKVRFTAIIKNIEFNVKDHIDKNINLVRAGPFNIRSPLLQVA